MRLGLLRKSYSFWCKKRVTINVAAKYFGIGIKKMRSMAEDNVSDAFLFTGNRYMVLRPVFEEYLNKLAKKKKEKGYVIICQTFL